MRRSIARLDAIIYFRRALDTDPTSIAALNGAGMAYLDIHDHTTALGYLNNCLNADPTNYACLDNVGVAKIQAGLYGDAIGVFMRAHRLEPERPEALVNFGYLADLRGDWKRAVAYYVEAIAVDPYVPESYVNLGIDYEKNGLYPLAQAALLKGIAAAPYDGRVHYLLARAYAAQGQEGTCLAAAQSGSEFARSRRRPDRQRRDGAPYDIFGDRSAVTAPLIPSSSGDAVDLDAGAARQGRDGDGRARGLGCAEVLFVHGVDRSEIVHVDQERSSS